jgi:hypothetical protein
MTFLNRTFLTNAFCAVTFYSYGTAMMDYLLVDQPHAKRVFT